MKILVLCGSPHKNGTTNVLAEAFLDGIDTEKHSVEKIWLQGKKTSPCLGCMYCKSHEGNCAVKDDTAEILRAVIEAELIVFVSPLYYFGMTSQLKMVIDRFFAVNDVLRQKEKKAILLTAGSDTDGWAMDGIRTHYEVMLKYLHWTSVGEICAYGCTTKEMLKATDYPAAAEKLGRSIG